MIKTTKQNQCINEKGYVIEFTDGTYYHPIFADGSIKNVDLIETYEEAKEIAKIFRDDVIHEIKRIRRTITVETLDNDV